MTRLLTSFCLAAIALGIASAIPVVHAQDRGIPAAEIKSGKAFVSRETQAQQDDLTDNPGMLWVEQGAELWKTAAGTSGKSCASCHGAPEAMKGVAARYPQVDVKLGRLVNIETRIQNCARVHQQAPEPAYESQSLLALTALVNHQSRGLPVSVKIDGEAAPYFAQGDKLFHEKQGHLDLSCAQCHVENWGKRLRTETLSQGYANGFPAYRLEWQTLGSSHRRLRACFNGVRAEPFPAGSPEFIALELYLAWRGEGLEVETPAVRR